MVCGFSEYLIKILLLLIEASLYFLIELLEQLLLSSLYFCAYGPIIRPRVDSLSFHQILEKVKFLFLVVVVAVIILLFRFFSHKIWNVAKAYWAWCLVLGLILSTLQMMHCFLECSLIIKVSTDRPPHWLIKLTSCVSPLIFSWRVCFFWTVCATTCWDGTTIFTFCTYGLQVDDTFVECALIFGRRLTTIISSRLRERIDGWLILSLRTQTWRILLLYDVHSWLPILLRYLHLLISGRAPLRIATILILIQVLAKHICLLRNLLQQVLIQL